jgi:hypothetical protein
MSLLPETRSFLIRALATIAAAPRDTPEALEFQARWRKMNAKQRLDEILRSEPSVSKGGVRLSSPSDDVRDNRHEAEDLVERLSR